MATLTNEMLSYFHGMSGGDVGVYEQWRQFTHNDPLERSLFLSLSFTLLLGGQTFSTEKANWPFKRR